MASPELMDYCCEMVFHQNWILEREVVYSGGLVEFLKMEWLTEKAALGVGDLIIMGSSWCVSSERVSNIEVETRKGRKESGDSQKTKMQKSRSKMNCINVSAHMY